MNGETRWGTIDDVGVLEIGGDIAVRPSARGAKTFGAGEQLLRGWLERVGPDEDDVQLRKRARELDDELDVDPGSCRVPT